MVSGLDINGDPAKRKLAALLEEFPLSHNARIMRIGLLLSVGEEDLAKSAAAVGVALYPNSPIMAIRFLRLFKNDLTDMEVRCIEARTAGAD